MKMMNNKDGYQAVSMIPFDDTRSLRIVTRKYLGELTTIASIVTNTDMGFAFMMLKDWNALVASDKTRVTTKAIKQQHEKVLTKVEDYKKAAFQFYSQRN
jgi:uncharacterized protein YmfQ (DUF2313 family)